MQAIGSMDHAFGWPLLVALGLVLLVAVVAAACIYGYVALRVSGPGGGRVRCDAYGPVEFGLGSALVGWFLFLLLGGWTGRVGEPGEITLRVLLLNAALPVALVLGVVIVLKARGHRVASLFGLDAQRQGRVWLIGLGLLLAAYPLLLALALVNLGLVGGEMRPQSLVRLMQESRDPGLQGAVIVLAVVLAPVTEEFLFRGFLYGVGKRYFGMWPTLAFTAALFAGIHLHAPSMLPLAGLAVCLTLAYELSGSLLVPMAMHALFNAASLAVVFYLREIAG